jgi:hypothetical protein
MQPNTNIWGSQSLTGAASLRYRMPVFGGCSNRIAQSAEHQIGNLRVAGSTPATTNGPDAANLDSKSSLHNTTVN